METGRYSDLGQMPIIVTLVKREYVENVDTLELFKAYVKTGNINGMLKTLGDPYTYYMDPDTYEDMHTSTSGRYEGIGVIIGLRDDKVTVVAPFKGAPGDIAGLKPEDRIIGVDGTSVEGMTLQQVVNLIKGPRATEVIVTIERGADNEKKDVKIIRDGITIPSVEKEFLEEDIGYIRLITFSEDTDTELDKAVNELRKEGAKGFVLDLRMNPGGLLTTALRITDKFINGGPMLHVVTRSGDKQTFNASPWSNIREPVVVLIDEGSASASEILSGALQDLDRAILVGTKTFGKGKVQSVIPLRDGSALSVTVAKYLTAGGKDINSTGVEPDIFVELPEPKEDEEFVEDLQLKKATEVLKKVMNGEIKGPEDLLLEHAS